MEEVRSARDESAQSAGRDAFEDADGRTPEEEFLATVLAGRDVSDLTDPEAERRAEQERLASMTPEQREAYSERDSLETVFGDVRLRSRSGELTGPDYWEEAGLVPAHMEPAAFTALVFDTIIAAQDRSQRCEEEEEAERALEETTPGQAGMWQLDDIKVIEGSRAYLYSSAEMTDSFARWAFLAAEHDDAATLVENARVESKVYPRPLKAKSLTNRPVYMSVERIEAAFAAVQASGLYPDIKRCAASNGDVYFYSTDYLSDAQAKALAEWESVERRANM